MREAANQHNIIFVAPHLPAPAQTGQHQVQAAQSSPRTGPQTMPVASKCTMCRTDKRIAQGIQKPVGKGFKRQTQMRAPVHKTAKPSLCVPDDKVETVITVRIRNYETACFFRLDSFCRTNNRAPGRQP